MSAPRHAPRVPFALLLGGLIVGAMCALLALNTASAANELDRHDYAAKDASVAARLQQLRIQVAASAAPGNLGSAAAALGMVPADNPAFLEVGTDGSVRVLGSPAPATALPLTAIPKPPPAPAPKPTPTKSAKTGAKPTSPKSSTKAVPTVPTVPTAPTPTPTPTKSLGGVR
jgi:outer membrane biosynthesis protein TonB